MTARLKLMTLPGLTRRWRAISPGFSRPIPDARARLRTLGPGGQDLRSFYGSCNVRRNSAMPHMPAAVGDLSPGINGHLALAGKPRLLVSYSALRPAQTSGQQR